MYTIKKEDEEARRRLHALGLSDKEIAAKLGKERTDITSWRNRRGLKCNTNYRRTITPEEEALRLEYYNAGLNDSQIGRIFNRTSACIKSWRDGRNLPPKNPNMSHKQSIAKIRQVSFREALPKRSWLTILKFLVLFDRLGKTVPSGQKVDVTAFIETFRAELNGWDAHHRSRRYNRAETY